MPLFREDLDPRHCDVPGCTVAHGEPTYIHARCHPKSPTWTRYLGGVLTIQCAKCKRDIVSIFVAARGGSR